MDFPYGTTVTIVANATSEDKYGDVTTTPTETTWGPCAIAPRTSTEREDSRTPAVVTGLTVYGPRVTLLPSSQVRIASGVYAGTWEVEGIPGDWLSPFTGWEPGIEVALTRASA